MKRLKERIQFISSDVVAESSGGFNRTSDNVLYECWANVKQSNSNREFQNFQNVNMVTVEITIRYAGSTFFPKMGMGAVWRDKLLTIHGEPDLGEKDFLRFFAAYDPYVEYANTDGNGS